MKSNPKTKTKANTADLIPRLVVTSGRTESSVEKLLRYVENHSTDTELHGLLAKIHKSNIVGHPYRGYTILGETSTTDVAVSLF